MFKLSKLSKMILDNKTVTVVISLLLAIYAGLAAPALPNSVILFFDTWYGKILFMFLIAFVASHNVQIALMVAVVFFVILHLATQLEVENFLANREHFQDTLLATTSTSSSKLTDDDKKFIDWTLSQQGDDVKNGIQLLLKDAEKNALLKQLASKSGVSEMKIKKLLNNIKSNTEFQNEVVKYAESKMSKKEAFTDSTEEEQQMTELFEDLNTLAKAVTEEVAKETTEETTTEGFESPLLNVSPADFSDDVGAPVDF